MNAIRVIRSEKGITQKAVAEAVGVSRQVISTWENGQWPSARAIPDIAEALGVSIQTLFDLSDDTHDTREEATGT